MTVLWNIQGAKKGASEARTPVETPDSLRSIAFAKIVDLISEGEIEGLVDGLKSVVLDGTPLENADGSFNFENVRIETRSGSQDQAHIAGFPSVENEIGVGVELRSDTPIVRTVSNPELSAVRVRLSVLALSKTDTTNGDIKPYRVSYAIDIAVDGGAFSTKITSAFSGKTTTKYERSHRIDLPEGSTWQVRVRRLTPNATSSTIADITMVESITEVIDAKLRYPNSAIAGIEVDASQFQNVPSRAYHVRGRRIRVPTNYDPATRNYSGVWDGTFKIAWTDNPAWIYYDLATNDRFGLGQLVNGEQVNRYALYRIAQYCDQLVSDGRGGQEPRFTCNVYLQTRAQAYKVLQDLASVFRGVSYYGGGQIIASSDMPRDPVYTYTAANVIDGRFTYEGSGRRTRHNVALVSWNDPTDFGRPKVEVVEYRPGIARYGIQQVEVTAFGCTSRAQAQRVGQHIVITDNLETETVTFSVGLDEMLVAPGDVINIADPARAGRRIGGRIKSATDTVVTVDRLPEVLNVGDSLRVALPNGRTEARTIQSIAGSAVTVTVPYSQVPVADGVWAVESSELALQTFSVLSIKEGDGITFAVTALKHVPGKFAAIDDGARIELPPISVVPPGVQAPPTNITLTDFSPIVQGIATHVLTISWIAPAKAVAYDVEWRRDDGEWVKAGRVTTTGIDIPGIYTGLYVARVRALNALGVASIPAVSAATQIDGKTSLPPALASLTATGVVFGIDLKWAFPPGATDTQRSEIWYSAVDDRATAIKLGDFAYPQNSHQLQGLAAGVTFFLWGRLVDRSGNIGPWYPDGALNGVVGQSSSDATPILGYLAGQIGKTELAQDLLEPIEGITPPMAGDAALFAGDSTRYAGVWSILSAAQEGDIALASRVDTVATRIDSNAALIQSESTARADADGALAQQVTTVQATANGAQASAQEALTATSTTDGRLNAFYTIRAQVDQNGKIYAAGMAIGVEQTMQGVQTQVLFQADRLALVNIANGVISTPFVIANGQTFISQAFIADGTITNAKIGDVIQSTALGAGGQPRWKLDKTGSLTMTGPVGGGYLQVNDQNIKVFSSGGVELVAIGDNI